MKLIKKYPNIFMLAVVIVVVVLLGILAFIVRNNESTPAASEDPTIDFRSTRIAVNNPGGERYCIAFCGSELDPTVVEISNCGSTPVTLTTNRQNLPTLVAAQAVMFYDIPSGYTRFEASAYREDGTQFGSVDFS